MILLEGIKFPYSIDEIKTEVRFNEGAMHVFMEVEKGADEFFEQEFWDQTFKHKRGVDDLPEDQKEMEFWDFKDNADKDYIAAEDAAEKLADKKAKQS